MQERRQPETISGRVNADGSIAGMVGGEFTVSRPGGAGVYNIAFPSSFRVMAANANRSDGVVGGAGSVSIGAGILAVTMFATNTTTATDMPFSFVAVGVQQ